MKRLLAILLIFLQFPLFGNMANPVMEGTLGGRPFVNEFVDVLHEDLFIKLDKNFKHASFNVKYHIKKGFIAIMPNLRIQVKIHIKIPAGEIAIFSR